MTEESGGPNLAAFVPLKLLMMHSRPRSTRGGSGRENLSSGDGDEGVGQRCGTWDSVILRVNPLVKLLSYSGEFM